MASNGSIISSFNINTVNNDQMFADIAFNNENYLVAWEDRRDDPAEIYYTLITPIGQVLSPIGIKISGKDPSDYYRTPTVASNRHDYLIAWLGIRSSGDVVLASRVNTAGDILDSVPFELSSDTSYINQIAAASDGIDYLVSWTSQTPGTTGLNLYFRRFSSDAAMLDTLPIMIAQNLSGIYDPAVNFSGGCYLVVWQGQDNIYGCRILPDGTVLDSGGFIICADSEQQVDPAVTGDGHRFLVTWTDSRSGNYDIYGVFVDSLANVGLAENILPAINIAMPVDISPIPFIDKVSIKFNPPDHNNLQLKIYDAFGRLVKSYEQRITDNAVVWDGKDNFGHILPTGTYFCRIRTNSASVTKRIVKIR